MAVEHTIGKHNQATAASIYHREGNDPIIKGDSDKLFIAASVTKLPAITAIYKLASEGSFDLEKRTRITGAEYLSEMATTGHLRFQPWYMLTTISPQELMKLSLQASDNMAFLALVNRVGRENIQQVLNFWGMNQTTVYNPSKGTNNKTSARDIGSFMDKFGNDELISPENTGEIKSWMPNKELPSSQGYNPVLRWKEGQIVDPVHYYLHKVGLIDGGGALETFVILTEGYSTGTLGVPYIQQKKVQEFMGTFLDRTR